MAIFGSEKDSKLLPVMKETKFSKNDEVIVDVCAEAKGEDYHFFPHLGFITEVDSKGRVKDIEISMIPLTERDLILSHSTEDGKIMLETIKYDGVDFKIVDDEKIEMNNTGLSVNRHHYTKEFGKDERSGKTKISYFFIHALQKPFRDLKVKK